MLNQSSSRYDFILLTSGDDFLTEFNLPKIIREGEENFKVLSTSRAEFLCFAKVKKIGYIAFSFSQDALFYQEV